MDIMTEDQERDWSAIQAAVRELGRSFQDFLQYVRDNYLEVDVDELSHNSWLAYVEYHNESLVETSKKK
jgi:hypothetical protein